MTAANAAILFHPESYTTGQPSLMGRQAAGEGFLRAFLRHAHADPIYCYAAEQAHAEVFARLRDEHGEPGATVRWIPHADIAALSAPGALYVPGPRLADLAWRRRRIGAHRFSLTGVTHTVASHAAMDSIAALMSAPVEPWDALVCTSRAVLDAVKRLLTAEAEYLRDRVHAQAFAWPELALIPLGVDCEALVADSEQRTAWRTRLGIGADDVAFLFLGRLSFHAKANPMPMYFALEEAARRSGRRLHLIQAGWFQNGQIQDHFVAGAKAACPSINAIFLDGRDAEVRSGIWHAADVFTSLVDNVQETFGLAPVEAMAAGLPCVVSDWNGYRETVRDGIDGFRIPTLASPPGSAAALAARHEDGADSYDRYIGYSSLAVSVDIVECAAAYGRLAGDAPLRRRMGDAARERARAEFDWPLIIRRYQALWETLAKRRRDAVLTNPPPVPNPRRADPFWLFAEYPTQVLHVQHRLVVASGADGARLAALDRSGLCNFGAAILPDADARLRLFEHVSRRPGVTVGELLSGAIEQRHAGLMRAIMWLIKFGLVRAQGSAGDARRQGTS